MIINLVGLVSLFDLSNRVANWYIVGNEFKKLTTEITKRVVKAILLHENKLHAYTPLQLSGLVFEIPIVHKEIPGPDSDLAPKL